MKNLKHIFTGIIVFVLMLLASLTAFAAVEDTGFSDVSADAWYTDAVVYCRDNGLMSGTGDTTFSPDASLTRDMLAAILYRMSGSPAVDRTDTFTDTVDGAWYKDAVTWASENGVISGYGNNTFGVGDAVTKEQMVTILWRYAGSPASLEGESFTDEASISSWAGTAADWARNHNYIGNITDNTFHPQENATRAEVAVMLMGYVTGPAETQQETENNQEAVDETESQLGPNVLIAYFSCTGNTKEVADELNTVIKADMYEITPETPYTQADLNYNDDNSRTSIEMNDPDARPAIAGSVENMDDYYVIFLGYPIWWSDAPKIIETFLESYDFNGKTIIPFCTSGSSGIGSSARNLQNLTQGATWLDGERFNSSVTASALSQWITGLGLDVDMAS